MECLGVSLLAKTNLDEPLVSGNTGLASDRTDDSSNCRVPSYMNLTESTKAKQKASSYQSQRIRRQSMDEFQFLKRSGAFSNRKVVLALSNLQSTSPNFACQAGWIRTP
ncbi:protein IQ-DOMAIN 1 [Prunus yedoensis var. nudiflora]|uniref:Protein IQ-DOMAIN 1 n=1 Tax=Prunus yedoensis var. nudiflora TaxID=2094558 RepID=A0A314ULU7_PRUYE|nr:protein IQ-DOMAIN 1 [Prunus yedoensis var. nudiflora]